MRYFQTQSPLSKLYLSGGRLVKWTAYDDGVVGWFATSDPVIAGQLTKFAEKKIGGGISEVTQAQYEGAAGKAKGRRFEPDREWVGSQGIKPAAQLPTGQAAVAAEPAPQADPVETRVRRRAKT